LEAIKIRTRPVLMTAFAGLCGNVTCRTRLCYRSREIGPSWRLVAIGGLVVGT